MKESELVRSILDYLTAKRIFHYRQNSGAFMSQNANGSKGFYRFGPNGAPDIICVPHEGPHRGVYTGIEAKVGYNKQSPAQVAFQEALEASGGRYFLIRDLTELQKIL